MEVERRAGDLLLVDLGAEYFVGGSVRWLIPANRVSLASETLYTMANADALTACRPLASLLS